MREYIEHTKVSRCAHDSQSLPSSVLHFVWNNMGGMDRSGDEERRRGLYDMACDLIRHL